MADVMDIFEALIRKLCWDPSFKLRTYLTNFGKLKTNVHRMNFVDRDLKTHKVYPSFNKDRKNDSTATHHREQGNEYYKAGKYREALDRYTLSVLNANSKETLAFAFGNRSAALLKLNLYQECLTDINRAFTNNYPDKLKPKLIQRQNFAKSQKVSKIIHYQPPPQFPESDKNSDIACARNCVKIVKNEQYGRHIITTRNIEVGEVLAVESSYVALIKNEVNIYCHECFNLCYNLIPCGSCTKALYCSDPCKDKAYEAYHKYECPILLTLDSVKIDNPKRLALKTVLLSRNEWNQRNANYNNLDSADDKIYLSNRYKEMCELLHHAETRKIENLFARTAVACVFFHLVKNYSSFFQDCANEDDFKENLLLMVLICGVNTVDINELSPNVLGIYDLNSVALAIYPFFTLFNHSCWPNVSRHFHGSSMVLRAVNSIKKGEQCFVVYGPHFLSYSKEFRQTFLAENQFFKCTCRACEENWPMSTSLSAMIPELNLLQFFTMMKLKEANVDTANEELQHLLVEAKKAESRLPPGRDYIIKDLLTFCYNIFGNKRKF